MSCNYWRNWDIVWRHRSGAGGSIEGQRRDLQWPVIFMGVLSTVLLSAGVLRHYFDIYIHRTVRGISFIFVGIDAAGDVFSLVSVCKSAESLATVQALITYSVFQSHLDILGLVIYATEFILWCGVFACGGYFNLLPWIRSRARKVSEDDSRDPTAAATHTNAVQIEEGISNDIELDRIDSSGSRTVFRTPGSIASADNTAR
ncbi:hypothetical protein CJF30_00006226 [Rutstroemia sp. NJR-2017a BBW]|nr:hypothetical protein CJF30_00006226 [Rutstroemia sp. NJR-2017a BBW]